MGPKHSVAGGLSLPLWLSLCGTEVVPLSSVILQAEREYVKFKASVSRDACRSC
jgi:hypothetical protein